MLQNTKLNLTNGFPHGSPWNPLALRKITSFVLCLWHSRICLMRNHTRMLAHQTQIIWIPALPTEVGVKIPGKAWERRQTGNGHHWWRWPLSLAPSLPSEVAWTLTGWYSSQHQGIQTGYTMNGPIVQLYKHYKCCNKWHFKIKVIRGYYFGLGFCMRPQKTTLKTTQHHQTEVIIWSLGKSGTKRGDHNQTSQAGLCESVWKQKSLLQSLPKSTLQESFALFCPCPCLTRKVTSKWPIRF